VKHFDLDIFELHENDLLFEQYAINAFKFQFANNKIYNEFVKHLKINPEQVNTITEIPFLPIQFFKTHQVTTQSNFEQIFTSSGTTGIEVSKHLIFDLNIYKASYLKAFTHFFGDISEYCILALLPSYLERKGSSLVYMVDDLIKKSKHPLSSFYIHDYEKLTYAIEKLKSQKQKTILLGVSYALLDLAEKKMQLDDHFLVMETGGMKGKRKEMVKQELHGVLKNGLGVNKIYSEYGMTELLSQAYSMTDGIFESPPWMRVLISEITDSRNFVSDQKTGIVNIIDLANWYSCPFIATQDLGKKLASNQFELIGRMDFSDVRGCNLLIA
jgi:phenylacetate-coenzyme A ligase PaaK-like adenylate-forming protein